jgi:tetratricopeptide (TPR) repeat protein
MVNVLQAATDVDIDTSTPTMATPTAVGTVISQQTVGQPIVSMTPIAIATSSIKTDPTPVLKVVEGILQMKEVYQAGIDCYKKQDFAKAIRYLKKSLDIHDPYTPKFYYAEANAMLGVIYQFNIIDKSLAYQYYREALVIDPRTKTAKKHIREVSATKKK